MSTGVKYQLSPKVGNSLINIQGDTAEEFAQALAWFNDNAQQVVETALALEAAHVVAAGLTGQQAAPAAQYQAPQQRSYSQAPPASPGSPSCAHGAMEYKSGTGNKGPWSAHFCPQKGSDCKPIWGGR